MYASSDCLSGDSPAVVEWRAGILLFLFCVVGFFFAALPLLWKYSRALPLAAGSLAPGPVNSLAPAVGRDQGKPAMDFVLIFFL